MKIEPVYLVAPKRRIPLKQAAAWCLLAAVAGLSVGALSTWVLTRGRSIKITSRLQQRISWATQIAASPSDKVLIDNLADFLSVTNEIGELGQIDGRLEDGTIRAAQVILSNESIPRRRELAKAVSSTLRANQMKSPELSIALESLPD